MNKYVDPRRAKSGGNQSEKPVLLNKKTHLTYSGYQKFDLYLNKVVNRSEVAKKVDSIKPYLIKHPKNKSIIDIGCSNFGIGFNLFHMGYQNITGVDHDKEYIANVQKGIKFLKSTTAKAMVKDITKIEEKYDIVMLYAVIHWIYSCTAGFGSLDKIIEFLSNMCNETLFIEWVDPVDGAIRVFKHIKFNPKVHQEPYNKVNFLAALRKRFPFVKLAGKIRNGREIWVASKRILDFGITKGYRKIKSATSSVFVDPNKHFVIKKNTNKNRSDCFFREVYWLQKLQKLDFVPKLLYFDKKQMYMVMDYCGERINDKNRPKDYLAQYKQILDQLKANDCYPHDIKLRSEVLVKGGKIFICDFGWCPTWKRDFTIGGKFKDLDAYLRGAICKKNLLADHL